MNVVGMLPMKGVLLVNASLYNYPYAISVALVYRHNKHYSSVC